MRLVKQLGTVGGVAVVGGLVAGAVTGSGCSRSSWASRRRCSRCSRTGGWYGRTEHRDPSTEVGWPGPGPPSAEGLGLGVAAVRGRHREHHASPAATRSTAGGSVPGAVGLFGFMAAVAVTEELLFRGVLFRHHRGAHRHVDRAGADRPCCSAWCTCSTRTPPCGARSPSPIEAGGMLAAAYVATRRLWVPIGLHFGWNFAASGIFSTDGLGQRHPAGAAGRRRRRARRCSPAATSARREACTRCCSACWRRSRSCGWPTGAAMLVPRRRRADGPTPTVTLSR